MILAYKQFWLSPKEFSHRWRWALAAFVAGFGIQAAQADGGQWEHAGLVTTVSEQQMTRCTTFGKLMLEVDATHPSDFLNLNTLQGLVDQVHADLAGACPRMREIYANGRHKGRFVGRVQASEYCDWQVYPKDQRAVYDLHTPATPSAGSPSVSAPDMLEEIMLGVRCGYNSARYDSRATQSAAGSADDLVALFYYRAPNGFNFDAVGSVDGQARYTDMSSELVGRSFLFFPYDSIEVTTGCRGDVCLDGETRQPAFMLTFHTDHAARQSASAYERFPYTIRGTGGPSESDYDAFPVGDSLVECIPMELLGGSECVFVQLWETSRGTVENYKVPSLIMLSRLIGKDELRDIGKGWIADSGWASSGLGYLTPVTEAEGRVALRAVESAQARLLAENAAAVDAGRPKPHLSFDYLQPLPRRSFSELYTGTASGPVSTYDHLIYLAFYAAYDELCASTILNPHTYNHMGTRVVDSETTFDGLGTNTTLYREIFVARSVQLPPEDAYTYQQIAQGLFARLLGDTARERGDIPFVHALALTNERGLQLVTASKAFLNREGCQTPTTDQFRDRLRASVR